MSSLMCVECATPVESLFTVLSGNHIRATQCHNCGKFADKYLEVEGIVVAIDVLLLRPGAIRHIVYNKSCNQGHEAPTLSNTAKKEVSLDAETKALQVFGLSSLTLRLIILSILSDVYFEWVNCEKTNSQLAQLFLSRVPFLVQYLLFLVLCVTDTFVTHFAVRRTAKCITGKELGGCVSTALLIGSYSKFLPLLTHIWKYDTKVMANIVDYAKYICMTDIMASAFNCSFARACIPTIISVLCSYVLHKAFWFIAKVFLTA